MGNRQFPYFKRQRPNRHKRQLGKLNGGRSQLLPHKLLHDSHHMVGLRQGSDAVTAARSGETGGWQQQGEAEILPQLLHLRLHYGLLAMAAVGALHRLDGSQRSEHAFCPHRAGIDMVSRVAEVRTHRCRHAELFHRTGVPALAPHVQHRPLERPAAKGMARRTV